MAVQLAANVILPGTATGALAGGVNLLLAPETTSIAQKAGMLSSDGRCKTLDASADGYGRGEACGLLLLAPTPGERVPIANAWVRSQSEADPACHEQSPTHGGIMGMIVGAAVGQDGRSSSLTAPNGPAQQTVIRAALQVSAHSPHKVEHMQMHGTGTSLGDPIEIGAASAIFGADLSPGDTHSGAEWAPAGPLVLMASKSWVGHSEPASGVTSTAHAFAALMHACSQPSTHLRSLNPHVASILGVESKRSLVASRQPAPLCEQPFGAPGATGLAGISSFAFQGTNAHILLHHKPAADPQQMRYAANSRLRSGLPWQRQRAWVAPQLHVLLTAAHRPASKPQQAVMECVIGGTASLAYFREHEVTGKGLMPGAAFFIVALAAGQALLLEGSRASPGGLHNQPLQRSRPHPTAAVLSAASIIAPCMLATHSGPLILQITVELKVGRTEIVSSDGSAAAGANIIAHMRATLAATSQSALTHSGSAPSEVNPLAGTHFLQRLSVPSPQAAMQSANVLPALASLADGSEADSAEEMGPATMDSMLQLGAAVDMPGGLHVPTGLEGMHLPEQPGSRTSPLGGCFVIAQVTIPKNMTAPRRFPDAVVCPLLHQLGSQSETLHKTQLNSSRWQTALHVSSAIELLVLRITMLCTVNLSLSQDAHLQAERTVRSRYHQLHIA